MSYIQIGVHQLNLLLHRGSCSIRTASGSDIHPESESTGSTGAVGTEFTDTRGAQLLELPKNPSKISEFLSSESSSGNAAATRGTPADEGISSQDVKVSLECSEEARFPAVPSRQELKSIQSSKSSDILFLKEKLVKKKR